MRRLIETLVFSLLLLSAAACIEYPNSHRETPGVRTRPILSLQNPGPDYQVIQKTVFHRDDGYIVEEVHLGAMTVRVWKPEELPQNAVRGQYGGGWTLSSDPPSSRHLGRPHHFRFRPGARRERIRLSTVQQPALPDRPPQRRCQA